MPLNPNIPMQVRGGILSQVGPGLSKGFAMAQNYQAMKMKKADDKRKSAVEKRKKELYDIETFAPIAEKFMALKDAADIPTATQLGRKPTRLEDFYTTNTPESVDDPRKQFGYNKPVEGLGLSLPDQIPAAYEDIQPTRQMVPLGLTRQPSDASMQAPVAVDPSKVSPLISTGEYRPSMQPGLSMPETAESQKIDKGMAYDDESKVAQWPSMLNYMKDKGLDVEGWDQEYTPEIGRKLQRVVDIRNSMIAAKTKSGGAASSTIKPYVSEDGKIKWGSINRSGVITPARIAGEERIPTAAFAPTAKEVGDYVIDRYGNKMYKTEETRKEKLDKEKVALDKETVAMQSAKEERSRIDWTKKHEKAKFAMVDDLSKIDQFTDLIGDVLNGQGIKGTTGLYKVGKLIPSTDWATANAKIERLISMGAINTMMELKSKSPTGSTGFGSLNAEELNTMKMSFSILADTNISPKEKVKELVRIDKVMNDYRGRVKDYEFDYTEYTRLNKMTPKPKNDVTEADIDNMSVEELNAFMGNK